MKKKKVYIADDDPCILEIISIILQEKGYEVETYSNEKLLQKIHTEKPDLILLDIRMSGINGGEVCRILKEAADTKTIPVILISANKDIREIAQVCQADDILEKPFDIVDLLNITQKYA